MTEEEIINAIRSGGRPGNLALKALYDSTAQSMLRFFVYSGVSGDDAKDILQDTFIKIVRSADSYKGEGAARSWIWQIARNCLTDHQRKQARRSTDEVAVNDEQWQAIAETTADSPAGDGNRTAEECVAQGLEVFARQMPERALALNLHMDGMSMAEIGDRIGRTAAATKEFLSQCRKKIQPFLAHCNDLLIA